MLSRLLLLLRLLLPRLRLLLLIMKVPDVEVVLQQFALQLGPPTHTVLLLHALQLLWGNARQQQFWGSSFLVPGVCQGLWCWAVNSV